MANNTSTFNFSFPWALALTVCVILAVEYGASHLPQSLWQRLWTLSSPKKDDIFRAKAQLKLIEDNKNLIVVVGSSQVGYGVDPIELAKRLTTDLKHPYQVISLGISGAGITEMYQILELILSKNPALIVASPNPARILSQHSKIERQSHFTYSFSRLLVLAQHYRSYFSTDQWRHFVRNAFLFNTIPSSRLIRSFKFHKSLPKALLAKNHHTATLFHHTKQLTKEEMAIQIGNFEPGLYNPNTEIQRLVAQEFINQIKHNRSRLLFLDFPMNPLMQQELKIVEPSLSYHTHLFQQLSEEYQVPYYSKEKLPNFKASGFYDTTHLNAQGRSVMNTYMANVIKKELTTR